VDGTRLMMMVVGERVYRVRQGVVTELVRTQTKVGFALHGAFAKDGKIVPYPDAADCCLTLQEAIAMAREQLATEEISIQRRREALMEWKLKAVRNDNGAGMVR
jgi:hypothetical protein